WPCAARRIHPTAPSNPPAASATAVITGWAVRERDMITSLATARRDPPIARKTPSAPNPIRPEPSSAGPLGTGTAAARLAEPGRPPSAGSPHRPEPSAPALPGVVWPGRVGENGGMPEGDTVWLACHRLNAALAGRRLVRAELRVPAFATENLVGRTVLEVVPR